MTAAQLQLLTGSPGLRAAESKEALFDQKEPTTTLVLQLDEPKETGSGYNSDREREREDGASTRDSERDTRDTRENGATSERRGDADGGEVALSISLDAPTDLPAAADSSAVSSLTVQHARVMLRLQAQQRRNSSSRSVSRQTSVAIANSSSGNSEAAAAQTLAAAAASPAALDRVASVTLPRPSHRRSDSDIDPAFDMPWTQKVRPALSVVPGS